MRRHVLTALTLALAACGGNAVEQTYFPVTVAPAAGAPNRLVAVPPDCTQTPETASRLWAGAWHNRELGLGCSQARNLGAVVADPRDLLSGRETGPADAEREAAAVQRYRKGEEKPLRPGGTAAYGGAPSGGR